MEEWLFGSEELPEWNTWDKLEYDGNVIWRFASWLDETISIGNLFGIETKPLLYNDDRDLSYNIWESKPTSVLQDVANGTSDIINGLSGTLNILGKSIHFIFSNSLITIGLGTFLIYSYLKPGQITNTIKGYSYVPKREKKKNYKKYKRKRI